MFATLSYTCPTMGAISQNHLYLPPSTGLPPADRHTTPAQGHSAGAAQAADAIGHVDIAKGVSEVQVHCLDHGIPRDYIETFAGYAKEHHLAFIVRARNPAGHTFHASCHPVLPHGFRLATAKNFGPLTGLIPADDTFLPQAKRLKDSGACSTPLTLTEARIDELAAQGALRKENGQAPGTLRLTCEQRHKAQPYVFTATKKSAGSDSYRISHNGKAVHVLGEDRGDRVLPYTDPIDIMAISAKDRETSAAHVDAMNSALGRAYKPVLQARDTAMHPYTDAADFFPCVVFGPPTMDIGGAAMAKDVNELSRLFGMAAAARCPLPVDSAWPADIKAALQGASSSVSASHGRRETALGKRLLSQTPSARRP